MQNHANQTCGRTGEAEAGAATAPGLLGDLETVRSVIFGNRISGRHILRLADSGKLPWGLKLGGRRLWNLDELRTWVNEGCKPVRTVNGRRGQ